MKVVCKPLPFPIDGVGNSYLFLIATLSRHDGMKGGWFLLRHAHIHGNGSELCHQQFSTTYVSLPIQEGTGAYRAEGRECAMTT